MEGKVIPFIFPIEGIYGKVRHEVKVLIFAVEEVMN
jgi:hypothetical protein